MSAQAIQLAPGVRGDEGASSVFQAVDALVFDLDGVVIDSSASYPRAVVASVDTFLEIAGVPRARAPRLSPEDTVHFKLAGGFNDEWDVTWVACLWSLWRAWDPGAPDLPSFGRTVAAAGGGVAGARAVLHAHAPAGVAQAVAERVDGGLPERLAMEYYAGEDAPRLYGFTPAYHHGPGFWQEERLLVAPDALRPWQGRLGVYTGRSDEEAEWALGHLGLADVFPPERRVTSSSGWRKPDPRGLVALTCRLPGHCLLFVGDNVDDAEAARRYEAERGAGAPVCLFAGIASPRRSAFAERLLQLGALVVADDVGSLLGYLAALGRPG